MTETKDGKKCCGKFKKVLFGLVAIVGILAVVVAMQPDEYSVSRTATIAASPAKVFEQVNNLQNWNAWSPWAKLDPEAKSTFEGPEAGTGAIMRWEGNKEVGVGSMSITESRPDEAVIIGLEFIKPMTGQATAEFTFKEEGKETVVTWTTSGKNNFVGKAVSLVMDCQKMMGGYQEEGLNNIKGIVEAPKEEKLAE
ncbi:MAG: polyketide cyclase [Rickettsiales bacterium]|jgi:hypothetical protein|nr:polyketide cyclase [Rickettsiales bacterium]